jgi:hypothetical protein
MNIVNASSDTIDNIVYMVTDAVGEPIIDRTDHACAVYESFFTGNEGGICYRVCGPIPPGSTPEKVEYFTRISHQGEEEPWKPCDGDGCMGEDMDYQSATGTLCSQFRLWKGRGDHRDLMIKVTLAKV